MGDEGDEEGTADQDRLDLDPVEIERAVLNDSEEGRQIAAGFVAVFGDFISTQVRPVLREVAAGGGEPQLLVNGLAELMRHIADTIEFPIGMRR
ncbi:hypothetical protein [Rhabdothermincola sp.]|uniref:hypothetical protein n=1 Tax=Rhabdothermincola sp. TaxID=2820405 RepID=UPI002FDFA95C